LATKMLASTVQFSSYGRASVQGAARVQRGRRPANRALPSAGIPAGRHRERGTRPFPQDPTACLSQAALGVRSTPLCGSTETTTNMLGRVVSVPPMSWATERSSVAECSLERR
jgi:hypothetical protein